MTTQRRKRRSYEDRTRSNTPAARMLAEAFTRKIEFTPGPDGEFIRVWRPDELQTYKNDDIARAISRRRAFEFHELVGDIPPTAVKYAVTKGWLVQLQGLYWVTEKAAAEFKLPATTADGVRIRFLKAVAA